MIIQAWRQGCQGRLFAAPCYRGRGRKHVPSSTVPIRWRDAAKRDSLWSAASSPDAVGAHTPLWLVDFLYLRWLRTPTKSVRTRYVSWRLQSFFRCRAKAARASRRAGTYRRTPKAVAFSEWIGRPGRLGRPRGGKAVATTSLGQGSVERQPWLADSYRDSDRSSRGSGWGRGLGAGSGVGRTGIIRGLVREVWIIWSSP